MNRARLRAWPAGAHGRADAHAYAANWGHDTIALWSAGTSNVLDMTALGSVHSMADLAITDVPGGVRISLAGDASLTNTISIAGIDSSAVTASKFKFA